MLDDFFKGCRADKYYKMHSFSVHNIQLDIYFGDRINCSVQNTTTIKNY